jgi:hypothetical protein
MKHFHSHKPLMSAGIISLVLSMLACNATKTATPEPNLSTNTIQEETGFTDTPPMVSTDTPLPLNTDTSAPTEIVHTMVPGELPAGIVSEVTDRNSSALAEQKRANGGDSYAANLYERPFNANTMDTYFSSLDINSAMLSESDIWVFATITLAGEDPKGGFQGVYGIEIDKDVDGRGDVLVMATKPGTTWAVKGVQAWIDGNQDVGANHPVNPDAPSTGDGYETNVFDQGGGEDADLAWARISPTDPNAVQLAFKQSLISNDNKFTWNAWAMAGTMFNPAWFDFNDHFTAEEMGSPLVELSKYYPIKALAEVDNTCRWVVGFTPTGSEPGICPLPATPTPAVPGTISGRVFNDDVDKDGIFGSGSYPYQNIPIEVHGGNCAGTLVGTTSSNSQGYYSISIPAGTYCVQITNRPDPGGASPRTITVPNGGTVPNVDFAFWST